MNNTANTCTACFSHGSRPHCREFDSNASAILVFSSLHATGSAPFMCQQPDTRYRVCHEPATATVSNVLFKARAA